MADPTAQPTTAPVSAPVPGSPEYNQAMIALADASGTQVRVLDGGRQQTTEAAPQVSPQEPPASLEVTPEVPPTETTEQTPNQEQTPAPLQAFYKEFEDTGDVSAESRTKLVELLKPAGLDETFINAYIEGQKALKASADTAQKAAAVAEAETRKVGFERAGGEQNYRAMTEWAKANLSPAELAAYNASVSKDQASALLAIDGLKARFQSATGRSPVFQLNGNSQGNGSNIQAFSNQEDVAAAISDPRYATSATYRQQVAQRLALTSDGITGTRIR